MNLKKFIRGLRTSAAFAGDRSDWERALLMINFSEEALLKIHQHENLPPGALEYCQGIIELTIQGKRVAKTRRQWADYLIGSTRDAATWMLGSPFRSDDSDTTKGMKLYTALLQLESFNKARPEATLDELVEKINKNLCEL
jgi:hypothetical protein